jgi:hypothetical protein
VNVSAIIVTRGDVDLGPILESLPSSWEVITWDNGDGLVYRNAGGSVVFGFPGDEVFEVGSDLFVYGRYAAIEYASHNLIYVQDDDCIVSDPQAIVDRWLWITRLRDVGLEEELHAVAGLRDQDLPIVANMPQEFRPHYPDSCLLGFGACFHRDLPDRAFERFLHPTRMDPEGGWIGYMDSVRLTSSMLRRTCDVVFTTLTPRVLVDVPVEVLSYAHGEGRMWKQPNHFGERTQVLEMARKVRDA